MAMKKLNYNTAKSSLDSSQLASVFSNGFTSKPISESEIKMIPLKEIQLDPKGEFQKLFPINEDDYENILESMKKKGFPKYQHILMATIIEEGIKIPIDGHTRIKAALEAEIEEIPVWELTFETRKEALLTAYAIQLNRRNLTDGQKLIAIEAMDSLKNPGRKSSEDNEEKETGKSAEKLGEQLGMSTRQVEKGRAILNSGDEETIEKVESGELSINAGYNKVKGKTSKPKKADDEDDISESLSDNEGTPAGLNFSHTDGIVRPSTKPSQEDEFDKRLIERYKDGFTAGIKKGFSEGAYQIYDKIISMLHEGKTVEEIENDDLFSDFTFSEIAPKFKIKTDDEGLLKEFNT